MVEKTWLFEVGIVVLRSMIDGRDTTLRLDAEREGRHVEQQHLVDLALEHAALDRGATRHHLVGIHGLVGRLAEDLFDLSLNHRHARHAADQDHLVDLFPRDSGILDGLLAGLDESSDQVRDELFELLAGDGRRQVGWAIARGGDEGKIDVRRLRRGEFVFGAFCSLPNALKGHVVAAQIDPGLALEVVDQLFAERAVEILTAEEGVAVGALDLEDPVRDLENRNIESAAAEVEYRDRLRFRHS